ncbi:MAG: hypothetical protein GX032_01210 [Tenericutes bacterium]|nr:hypothetical protein [Bacilli bacterium]MDD4831954.1 hypothetical protein [Bacilli bacterium]NLV90078.1 hypothetical protein [Mycoplasmatota bacterium]
MEEEMVVKNVSDSELKKERNLQLLKASAILFASVILKNINYRYMNFLPELVMFYGIYETYNYIKLRGKKSYIESNRVKTLMKG